MGYTYWRNTNTYENILTNRIIPYYEFIFLIPFFMKNNNFQMVFKTVEMKAGKIKITGFASTPEIDRYDDIVKPSAFQGAMVGYMKNPVVLLQHNAEKPIGQVISYQILSTGLEVTAEISNDIENTFQLIQDKILRGFSIGFIAKSWNMTETNGREIREITDVDLIEISVVSTPANPGSLFTLAKSVREFFLTKDKEAKDVEIIDETPSEVTEEIIESIEPEAEVVEEIVEEAKTAEVEPEAVTEAEPIIEPTPETEEEAKEIQTDNLETAVETTDTPEKVEEGAEVIEAIEPEAVPEVNAEVEALKAEVAELKEDIATKAEKMASMEYVIANLTEKSVSLEEKMQKV
jgi:HK97 family phage prohead protease